MGGNALKSQGAVRCSKDVFTQVKDDFFSRFEKIAASYDIHIRFEALRSYRNKQDFGDLDVLIERNFFKAFDRQQIIDMLSESYGQPLPFVSNGPVLSVGLPLEQEGKYLQADLISTPSDEFDFSREYFAWNDAGNLIGRVAHKMGLKYGHDGLWYVLRDGTNVVATLLVSREIDLVLDFLGYDPTRWHEGFDDIEDVYSFIASGSRFNADIFQFENRNHVARVRDKKRPVYTGFLRWIENQDHLRSFPFDKDKSVYLDEIMRSFPGMRGQYQQAIDNLNRKKKLKSKFNGSIVSELTGLSGKELGQFIASFKNANPTFDEDSVEMTEIEIADMIVSHLYDFDGCNNSVYEHYDRMAGARNEE